jgi:hypothetical protein
MRTTTDSIDSTRASRVGRGVHTRSGLQGEVWMNMRTRRMDFFFVEWQRPATPPPPATPAPEPAVARDGRTDQALTLGCAAFILLTTCVTAVAQLALMLAR